MNPWWASEKNADGTIRRVFPQARGKRSQDLPSLYCPTGAIWIAKSVEFKAQKTFYGPSYQMYEMSWETAVDIDDYDDLAFAKATFLLLQRVRNTGIQ